MLRTIVLASLAVLLAQGVASAEIVDFEGRYWFTDVTASLKAKSGSLPATDVDFVDDLGLKNDNAPEGRLTFFTGLNSRIRLAYLNLDMHGDQTLNRTITFEGDTFTASSRVASDVEIHYGRLGWIWQPLAIPGLIKVGPVLELKGFLIDAELRTRDVSPTIKERAMFPLVLPTVGAALDISPHRMITLFGEASGLPAGDYGHIVDAEAGIRFIPVSFFTVSAGYRVVDLRIGQHDDFAKMRIFGPFVGASLRF